MCNKIASLTRTTILSIALLVLVGCVTPTQFKVAATQSKESKPAVSFNEKSGEFLVAYLEQQSFAYSQPNELRVVRFSDSGVPQGGVVQPLGSGSHEAIGMPAIAYSPKSDLFLVAIPERLQNYDRVIARLLDGKGSPLPAPEFLFANLQGTFYDGPTSQGSPGSVQVTHNALLDEFVVTAQFTVNGNNRVYGQRITTTGLQGSPLLLHDAGPSGFETHAIAYAPVPNTSPLGGRYLFGVSGNPGLLDAQLNLIKTTATDPTKPTTATGTYIPLNFGKPKGKEREFTASYGEVAGNKRFLLVWSDWNNCRPGSSPCEEWTGVWGTYIDPDKLFYSDLQPNSAVNTPFPISKIVIHTTTFNANPRVSYSEADKAFYVVWRELPADNPSNPIKLSHIRGVWVDYFIADGIADTANVPLPHDNVVLSAMHGSCQTAWPFLCLSDEDPDFPNVAGMSGKKAAVVWQQNNPNVAKDLNIYADFLKMP